MNHISKTSTKERFQFPENKLYEIGYDNTSVDCLQMAQKKNIPGINSLTETQRLALSKLENNTYQDGYRNDGSVIYGTGECIIPQNVAREYDLQNCRVGNLQLETDNPIIQNISWRNYRGCVINSNVFDTKIIDIARTLDSISTNDIRNSQQVIIDQTTTTYGQANQLDTSTLNALQTASNTSNLTNTVNGSEASLRTQVDIAESNVRRNNDLVQTYNIAIQDGQEFATFINDKIIGIRWYAYNEYYNDSQTYLNNIWSGKAVPFDAGITQTINGFNGITGKLSSYTIDNFTQNFTLLFEFIFRPDVSGNWGFQITSDDSSHFWINSLQIDDGNGPMFFSGNNTLNINNATIVNSGLHGMVSKSATKDLTAGNLYKCYVVQGNQGTTSSSQSRDNPTDIRFEVRRPSNTWFTLRSGEPGPGAANSEKWSSRYMVYDTFKKGMMAKVYDGYFADNTTWVRQKKPLSAVRLRQAINSDSVSPLGHGMVQKGVFRNQNPELIRTWNHLNANPDKTHLYNKELRDFTSNDLRTITFVGFFQPPRNGSYTFYFEGDDAIYMWIGQSAKEFTSTNLRSAFDAIEGAANAVNKLPGPHGPLSKPYTITLDASNMYLIRVMQGDQGGWNYLRFGYREPHGLIRWDLTLAFRF